MRMFAVVCGLRETGMPGQMKLVVAPLAVFTTTQMPSAPALHSGCRAPVVARRLGWWLKPCLSEDEIATAINSVN